MISTNFKIILLVSVICMVCCQITTGQDIAELASRARDHLYETWNFDSVAYYHNQVIGKKYAPAFAYSDYGWYLMLEDRYDEGLAMIEQAAVMAPSDVQMVTWHAWALLWDKDIPGARKWIQKALDLDPENGEALHVASLIASESGDHQAALEYAKNATKVDSHWRAGISLAWARAGDHDKASALADEIAPDADAYDSIILAEVYGYLEDRDSALLCLQKAFSKRHPFMPWLEFLPGTRELHDDPRFHAILRQMNLPE